jgi:hypothetical protein
VVVDTSAVLLVIGVALKCRDTYGAILGAQAGAGAPAVIEIPELPEAWT